MLKGFVSGEEKDIKRIPMKGKQLFDKSTLTTNRYVSNSNGELVYYSGGSLSASDYIDISDTVYVSITAQGGNEWGAFYNAEKEFVSGITGYTNQIQIPDNVKYMRLTVKTASFDSFMVNEGSIALPYEPYGYQEGWEVRDNQDGLIWGREDELQTATGTLPFKGYTLPLKVKSLLGNAVQNGTPAPDNIITPEMCGVRTGNLLNSAIIENGKGVDTSGNVVSYETRIATVQPIDITEIDSAVLSYSSTNPIMFIYAVLNNGTLVRRTASKTTGADLDLQGGNELYLCWYYTGTVTKSDISNIMLNPGSTALPYEPYGWKVPFENHGENLFYSDRTNQNMTASSTIYQTEGSSELVISKNETSSAVALSVTINLPLRAGTYTVSIDGLSIIEGNLDRINLRDSNGVIVNNVMTGSPQTFTIAADTVVNAVVFVCDSTSKYTNKKVRIMLTPGSTPKPYSPYLNATIPVYLGEVPTVRRVKKVRLDDLSWDVVDVSGVTLFRTNANLPRPYGAGDTTLYCDRYKPVESRTQAASEDYTIAPYNTTSSNRMCVHDSRYQTAEAWIADNGDASLWYILSEPETIISNEPLCKISTYADELTTIQVHGLSAPLYGIGDYKDTLNLSTGVVTRKVKKLVLTGEESDINKNLSSDTNYLYWFRLPNTLSVLIGAQVCMCSHLQYVNYAPSGNRAISTTGTRIFYLNFGADVMNAQASGNTVAGFREYLASQYAAGTPVTIWYVLDTPTTETVTVPTGMTGEIEGYLTQVSTPTPTKRSVPKWNGVEETGGTYAVTVYTPPEIPTTTGQNTLTVDTTLAPSNLTVKGHIKELT